MVDKPQSNDSSTGPASASPAASPRRPSGHRGADMRDTVAELTERAHLISQEAGGKVAAAMKDVISAGAGIAGFAIESARDLVQFMVRRGQMTPEEGDKLIREAESAHSKRPAAERKRPTASEITAKERAAARAKAAAEREQAMAQHIARVTAPHAASVKKEAPKKASAPKQRAKKTKPARRAKRR